MKMTVDHLVVVKQDVELPDKCPNEECGHEFKDESELQVWEYQDQGRTAYLIADGTELEWPNLPKSGESWIYISWACMKCDCVLAENNVKYFSMDEDSTLPSPPAGIRDLLNLDGTQEVQG